MEKTEIKDIQALYNSWVKEGPNRCVVFIAYDGDAPTVGLTGNTFNIAEGIMRSLYDDRDLRNMSMAVMTAYVRAAFESFNKRDAQHPETTEPANQE